MGALWGVLCDGVRSAAPCRALPPWKRPCTGHWRICPWFPSASWGERGSWWRSHATTGAKGGGRRDCVSGERGEDRRSETDDCEGSTHLHNLLGKLVEHPMQLVNWSLKINSKKHHETRYWPDYANIPSHQENRHGEFCAKPVVRIGSEQREKHATIVVLNHPHSHSL